MKLNRPFLFTLILFTYFSLAASVLASSPSPRGSAFEIPSAHESRGFSPQVAMGPSGSFVVVYQALDPTTEETGIFAQLLDPQGALQGDAISVHETSPATSPAVAIDRDGNFAVTWLSTLGGRPVVLARGFSSAGAALSEPFRLRTGRCTGTDEVTCVGFSRPEIAAGDHGFLAVWNHLEFRSEVEISSQVEGRALTLQRADSLQGFLTNLPGADATVAVDEGGGFYVVYEDRHHNGIRRLKVDSRGRRHLTANPLIIDGGFRPAAASSGGSGELFAAWQNDLPGSDEEIRVGRFDIDGEPQGNVVNLDTSLDGEQTPPRIAVDEDGNHVVVWEKKGAANEAGRIRGLKLNRAGRPVGEEFSVSSDLSEAATRPLLAMNRRGDFVVVWEHPLSDGTTRMRARLFTAYSCLEDDFTLCLDGGRFQVQTNWRDFADRTGKGKARQITQDTGYFWFFSPNNIELMLKVLDGRAINGRFWIFYGALSNVEYEISVTDTSNGNDRPYFNPLHRFASFGDTDALPGVKANDEFFDMHRIAPATPDPVIARRKGEAAGVCTPGPEALCLNDGRFRVTVDWKNFQGAQGSGVAGELVDDTGYFWFFQEENLELVVKILDGRDINDHFWVFYGALTNVEYTIRVEDTVTGEEREYFNPLHRFASYGDQTAFP